MQYEPLIADSYYHIFNRGNNKQPIFFEEKNYYYFLNLIKKYLVPVCDIYAYCLLSNHFHLLIKTKGEIADKAIPQAFSNCFNSYTKAINKSYNRSGSLFQDRFKRKVVQDENYLRKLIIYIHLNPELHQLIGDFTKYDFSSYKGFLSAKPSLLKRQEVLGLFNSLENFKFLHAERNFQIEQNKEELFLE
ncbi:MAG: transposase [Christiangramia sp.]|nr:transposase [Christiangramia sp.]